MKQFQSKILSAMLVGLCSVAAFAQSSAPAATLPQYSDSDKKKIAEIEQRPEIKDEIERQWETRRLEDLDYIYNLNSSAHFTDISGPQFAEYRKKYGQLYGNPMLQRYLNTMGQRLVPSNSAHLYSFKIVLYPIPLAESYSTGTIVVSTGLISMLDNEAQLAYVLGHEIAHVERNHHYEYVRQPIIEEALNKEKQESAEKKKNLFTAAVTLASAGIGGATNGARGAVAAGSLGLVGGLVAGHFIFRDHTTSTEWSEVFENEADQASLGYVLAQSYDVREAPKLYARLEAAAKLDPRIGLGFIAKAPRMKARNARIQELLTGDMKASIDAKLKAGGLTGSSGEFNLIMASLKRDNGIVAIDYDLFAMARDNLEEAVSLRSNDARAQLYLGKVISLTARSPEDRQEAEQHFLKAIKYDEARGAYADPHLEHALHLMGENGDKAEIRKEVESYVALYQRENVGRLPPNIHILYDYLTLEGDTSWYVAPVAVVSTKNVEPLRTSGAGPSVGLTGAEVVAAATSTNRPSSSNLESTAAEPAGAKALPVASKKPVPK